MKADTSIKARGFQCVRERMDIADFDLVKWLTHSKEEVKVVGIAKHLCGGATDLALTSFEHLKKLEDFPSKLAGLSIATCCHHACDTKTYVNLAFIAKEIPELVTAEGDISTLEFQRLMRCSSWGVAPQISIEKRTCGFQVKRIIDLGRSLFI